MNKRYFFESTIRAFLSKDPIWILGELCNNDEYDSDATQKYAWREEIRILKNVLQDISKDGRIVFEYTIPRLGKRIDVVLLLCERIFVLEFKAGETVFNRHDVDQVMDYALDLKNFHQGSADRMIVPILIATDSSNSSTQCQVSHYDDGIYEPLMTNAAKLNSVISSVLQQTIPQAPYKIDFKDWIKSRYEPTPTIIEAASALYTQHSVDEITRHEAAGEQLDKTTDYVLNVIKQTKEKKGKSICFVTGVPGAGKTLVGLNVAIRQSEHEKGERPDLAVYLSGNGPLVQVLTEALARDKKRQLNEQGEKYNITDARREVSQFIQIIHRYRDNMLQKIKTPIENDTLTIDPQKEIKDVHSGYGEVEHIAIFDEAQRSWDKEHIAGWLSRKKGINNFPMSEGEFLIWSLDQRQDWAVIVCLVGGGQEINTGEAGIGEWVRALNETFPDWQVYISSQLTAKEYAEGKVEELLINNPNVIFSEELHLAVSMRSFRAEHLSNMVHELLDGNVIKAKNIYNYFKDKYPLVITRDLETAKHWLRTKARGNERYGLVVSSKAARLKPIAIDVRCQPDTVHWFLDDITDVRSSLFLEDAASEFDIQGLELDWTCLVWDGDMRWAGTHWEHFNFNGGNKWNRINQIERRDYQINAYRVLLTRARQGMIICVPKGNREDLTRLPEFYDSTYEYLKSIGLEEI